MPTDTVVEALRLALAESPNDAALCIHLAQLLVDRDASESLELVQRVLATEPARLDAIEIAKNAARTCGETELAEQYEQLQKALGDGSATAPPATHQKLGAGRPKAARLRVVDGGKGDDDEFEIEEVELSLADVGGMESVKRRLELSFLGPLRNPEMSKAFGKSLQGGLLLYGPPGCGKTFIARALAGEMGAAFVSVGLTDVLDMYVGQTERRLHAIFEQARRNAPTVLFFDELDALGQKRSQLRNTGMRKAVNQLLMELDSLNSDNRDLFVLGATNHPWDIDAALRRPGRFDRIIEVFPPDEPARKSILEYHLRGKPADDVDCAKIAARTPEFSGADLRLLCESAAEQALEASLETGRVKPILTNDLVALVSQQRPSTRGWFETAKNYAMFANRDGTYDRLLEYLRERGW